MSQSVWCLLFVFRSGIISVLALCTCKRHKLPHLPSPLFYDLGAHPCTYGLPAFPDGEAELLLEGNRGDEFDAQGDIVTGHDHLHPFGKLRYPGYVRCPDVELGAVAA